MEYVTPDELVQFLCTYKKITDMTLRELAKATGVSVSALGRIMNKKQHMDMVVYQDILSYFIAIGGGKFASTS
jgi:transcriptional regulator with XRE-family HTH domain